MSAYDELFRFTRRGFDRPPELSLEDVPDDVEVLHITGKTLGLERLPYFPNLRTINAHDIADSDFASICNASQITHLSANIHRMSDIESVERLSNLQVLELTDNSKLDNLNGIKPLDKLIALALVNCPVTISLDPISECKALQFLWLSSAYEKSMRVNSLLPLSELIELEVVYLQNVRVVDRKLSPLLNLPKLTQVELPNFFSKREFDALAHSFPNLQGRWLARLGAR